MEQILITRIEAGIRALKFGTKSPKEVGLSSAFEKLKSVNEPMYDDLMDKYKGAVKKYKEEHEQD